jgi:HicB family
VQVSRFVEALRADLAAVAELGDEATAEAAARLSVTLQASVSLRLLDALTEAAVELNAQLTSGHVEVRLIGQDPQLVFVDEEAGAAPVASDEAFTARITLRLPDALKKSIEAAALRDGVSTNTWLVRALSRSVSGPAPRSGSRLTGFARS